MSATLTVEGDPKVLMSHRYLLFGVTWTHDGLEVLTVPGIGTRSGELWRVTADGSGKPRRVPYTGDEVANPIVSRQGSRLAYSQGVFEDRNIWRLPLTAHGEGAGAPARFASSTRHDASAAYSPDGRKVAFHSTRSGSDEIWVAAADGTGAVQLTSLAGPRCGTPRWSPDSSAIAFEANPDGNWDVFVIPAAGGKARRLTTQPTQEAVPSWSHDGRSIYFWSDRTGTPQIWKMPSSGGDAVQVTRRGGFEALESSDGRVLYFTKTDDGKEGLWSMPVSGGEEVQVVDAVIAARAFAIVPGGIYYIRGVSSDGNYFVPRTESDTINFYSLRTRQRRLGGRSAESLVVPERVAGRRLPLVFPKRPGQQRPQARGPVQVTSHGSITGQTLTHYEVLEQIGEGGMGVVYKARDTQLDRVVAIKVLAARRIAEPSATERFLQEAKAASALNHPNIVTIYGVDRAGDVDFIAMEYVAGQPLDRLMARARLPLPTILRYAVQVADALAAAHAAGIVHRDLKPSNVMVTDTGLVKVLDFGLAKLTETKPGEIAATDTRVIGPSTPSSEEGFIVGTLAYMSPEQAEGRPG